MNWPAYKPCLFLKNGYDERIDFVKGLCILFVVLNHCIDDLQGVLFPLWGAPAVSLFLLIQVFHVYKKETTLDRVNWKAIFRHTIFQRVVKPFLIVQALLIVIWLVCYDLPLGEQLKLAAYKGGKGPGAYYIWVYVQFALLLPILAPILKKLNPVVCLFAFLFLSQMAETLMCVLNIPPNIYQLTFFRYLFLIFLGYWLSTRPFVLTPMALALSLLSLLTLLFFSYTDLPLRPLFYNHPHFTTCHWPCYFYVALLLLFLYVKAYSVLSTYTAKVKGFFCTMGKESFNIFLSQMALFSILDIFPMRPWLISHAGELLGSMFYIVLCVILSTSPAWMMPLLKPRK